MATNNKNGKTSQEIERTVGIAIPVELVETYLDCHYEVTPANIERVYKKIEETWQNEISCIVEQAVLKVVE